MQMLKYPSFTPKSSIKQWPAFGMLGTQVFGAYWVNRAGTAEERKQIVC